MNHLGTVTLETERLILRPFQLEDASDMYHNWAGSKLVTKFLGWPAHTSVEESRKILDTWVKNYADPKYYEWCLESKENNQAIGSMGVVKVDESIEAVEIGYCIGESYWHKGMTAEALQAVVRFLFEQVGCNRISANHDINNPNSGKVMKKAGLQYEGTLLQAGKSNAGIFDMAVHGITRAMYFARFSGELAAETRRNT